MSECSIYFLSKKVVINKAFLEKLNQKCQYLWQMSIENKGEYVSLSKKVDYLSLDGMKLGIEGTTSQIAEFFQAEHLSKCYVTGVFHFIEENNKGQLNLTAIYDSKHRRML